MGNGIGLPSSGKPPGVRASAPNRCERGQVANKIMLMPMAFYVNVSNGLIIKKKPAGVGWPCNGAVLKGMLRP